METLDAGFLASLLPSASSVPPASGDGYVTADNAHAVGRLLLRCTPAELAEAQAVGLFALAQEVLQHVLLDADEAEETREANDALMKKVHEAISMNEVLSRKLGKVSKRNHEMERENRALKAILYNAAEGAHLPFPVREVGGPARVWTTQDSERAATTIQRTFRGHNARKDEAGRRDALAAGLLVEDEDGAGAALSNPADADAAAWGEWEELRPMKPAA